MGYIAITKKGRLVVDKTSECIILGNRKNYVFFELEVSISPTDHSNDEEFISIYVPGKIKKVASGQKITNSLFFFEWYYSQKKIIRQQSNKFEINGKLTEIISPQLKSSYNHENNVTEISLDFTASLHNKNSTSQSYHIFFTYETKQNITKTFGTLTVQSRYFDRKECPFGNFFENTVLNGEVNCPSSMYCWIISKPAFYLDNYSSFTNSQPRDIRIIEPTYLRMLNNKSKISRAITRLNCYCFGYPQVINWSFRNSDITFDKSYLEKGKWDEIRLIATFKGYELSSLFILVASISSIIALVAYLIEKLWLN